MLSELIQKGNEMNSNAVEKIFPDSEVEIKNTLDQDDAGIFGVKANGECVFVNQYAIKKLGFGNAKELIGHFIIDLLVPDISHLEANTSAINYFDELINSDICVKARLGVLKLKDKNDCQINFWVYPLQENVYQIKALVGFKPINADTKIEPASQLELERFKTLLLGTQNHSGRNTFTLSIARKSLKNAKISLLKVAMLLTF